MCGECLQCLSHTGFAPTHNVHASLVYTAQAPGCSAGELSQAGPGLRALPRSKLLRFWFLGTPQMHRLGWTCVLCPSQVWAAQVTCWAHSPQMVGASFHLPCPSCSVSWVHSRSTISGVPCVLWGADLWLWPSWQMSTIQDPRKTWLATGSLLTVWQRMLSLGLRLPLTFWPWLSPACLSASGCWGRKLAPPASSPLVFA